MRTWKDVATLVKTRNLNGRFVVQSTTGLPFVLEEGMNVAFVPPRTDAPRTATVDYVNALSENSYEVGFDAVTDRNGAHVLVGCHCLVKRDSIDDMLYEESPGAWAGWLVKEADGTTIGEVAGMEENPAHPLLEVTRRQDGKAVFIPVVDEFIVDVNAEDGEIVVDLPTGLLDL